ncbi:nucleotidyltransferase [bacterium]|nr:nucleotidyltransferase [bacterium]NUN44704.1 nucleotidyltransferase [bacterium]
MLLDEALIAIATQLNEASIPYMIVGGQAAIYYGETRFTKDIDVTMRLLPDQCEDVLKKLTAFESMTDHPETFARDTWVLPLRHRSTGIKVDLIFSATQFEYDAITNGQRKQIRGTEVNFIAPEYLIVQKLIAGRPKDVDDVQKIIQVQKDRLNIRRIEQMIRQFDDELGQTDFFQLWKTTIKIDIK